MCSDPAPRFGCFGRVVTVVLGVPLGLLLTVLVVHQLIPWIERVSRSPHGEPAASLEALWIAAEAHQRGGSGWVEPTIIEAGTFGWRPAPSLDCRFWVEPLQDLDTVLAHGLCGASAGVDAVHWVRVPGGRPVVLEPTATRNFR